MVDVYMPQLGQLSERPSVPPDEESGRRWGAGMTYTYTYVLVPVSQLAFEEVRRKLEQAGYGHAIDGNIIDMHGLALELAQTAERPAEAPERSEGAGSAGRQTAPGGAA